MFLRTTRPAKQSRRQQTRNRHHRQDVQQLRIAPAQLAQFFLDLGEQVRLPIDPEVLYFIAKGHRHLGLFLDIANPQRSTIRGAVPNLIMRLIRCPEALSKQRPQDPFSHQ